MTIEPNELVELKKIYFKRYGINLSDEQTLALGLRLVSLFKVVAKPFPLLDNLEPTVQNRISS